MTGHVLAFGTFVVEREDHWERFQIAFQGIKGEPERFERESAEQNRIPRFAQ